MDKNRYSFEVAKADPSLPIVIDPILQSTYLGGSENDSAYALAIHPTTGEIYVAGVTKSKDFPQTAGGAQEWCNKWVIYLIKSCYDVFVARLNKDLTQILQSTYLGGSDEDYVTALAIHPKTGEVYVAGETKSKNFPKTTGGAQAVYGGGYRYYKGDAFVARLNKELTQILQSTYLGGSSRDYATALAIHPKTGEVYVAGATKSIDFPNTTGGAQRKYSGSGEDAFVARLNKELTQILQSTYLGGSGIDWAKALAIHPQTGEVYVAGNTWFTANFVVRLNKELTQILQATYPGESGPFSVLALAIHPKTGEVYVAGETWSKDFPKTAGGAQAVYGGGDEDAFVARLNKDLTQILQATYLGGSSNDNANALAIHPQTGEIYVAGWTTSNDFPKTACGAQTKCNKCITYKYYGGSGDAFVARLSADLSAGNGSGSGGSSGGSGCRYPIFKSSKALLVFVVGRRIRRK